MKRYRFTCARKILTLIARLMQTIAKILQWADLKFPLSENTLMQFTMSSKQ